MQILNLCTWNIHQQGRTANEIPLWILDELSQKDPSIFVLTEFNSQASNITEFLKELSNKGYSYRISQFDSIGSRDNDILIAVKNVYTIEQTIFFNAYPHGTSNKSIPENLRVDIDFNGQIISIFGIRIKTLGRNYAQRKTQLDTLSSWITHIENPVILMGDFNNAKHYGCLDFPFQTVEHQYWRGGEKLDHYKYNLHIIKDAMRSIGLDLIENFEEAGASYIQKYTNKEKHTNIPIHNDHIFVDAKYFIGKISYDADWNFVSLVPKIKDYSADKYKTDSKKLEEGFPDHAILTATVYWDTNNLENLLSQLFPNGGETYTAQQLQEIFELNGIAYEEFNDTIGALVSIGWVIDCGNNIYTR